MKRSYLSILAFTMHAQGFLRGPQFCLPYDAVTQADACDPNLNGLMSTVWFNSRKNITAYPTAKATTTSDDLGIMEDDYTVASGKPFKTLQHDHEISDLKHEGTAAGLGPFKVTAKLFVRGSKDVITGFAAQAQYDEMVFVAQLSDGTRWPIGNAQFPARVKAMFDSKAVGATDPRGWEFEITSMSVYPERLDPTSVVPLV